MIFLPLAALLVGFALVYVFAQGFQPSETFARYMAIAVLAGMDTVLGGVRAWMTDQFDDAVFISGFFINALLAAGLVALGEKLGLETGLVDQSISVMMIAAVVVFSGRIFSNLAWLRRLIIENWRDGRNARRAQVETEVVDERARTLDAPTGAKTAG